MGQLLFPHENPRLDVKGAGQEGLSKRYMNWLIFIIQVFYFSRKLKLNSIKAKKLIKQLSYQFPFFLKVSPIGFRGSLWILGKILQTFNFKFYFSRVGFCKVILRMILIV